MKEKWKKKWKKKINKYRILYISLRLRLQHNCRTLARAVPRGEVKDAESVCGRSVPRGGDSSGVVESTGGVRSWAAPVVASQRSGLIMSADPSDITAASSVSSKSIIRRLVPAEEV